MQQFILMAEKLTDQSQTRRDLNCDNFYSVQKRNKTNYFLA